MSQEERNIQLGEIPKSNLMAIPGATDAVDDGR